jgi:HEAT repeat protein
MSDNRPVKRGVLSGLMGLFGDEEAAGQPPVARADDGTAYVQPVTSARNAADDRPPGQRPRPDVVREAYEPGWYRISAAMPVSADEEADERQDEEEAYEDEPAEQPPLEQAPSDQAASDDQPIDERSAEEADAAEPIVELPVATEPPAAEEAHPVVAESPEQVAESPEQAKEQEPVEVAATAEPPVFEGPAAEIPGSDPVREQAALGHEDQPLASSWPTEDAVSEAPIGAYAEHVSEPAEEAGREERDVADDRVPQHPVEEQPRPMAATEDVSADASSEVASSEVASSEVASSEVASQEVASQEVAPPETPPREAGPGDPRLRSRDVAQRREGVMALAAGALTDDDVAVLASMLQDPERGIRVLVLQTLARRADQVDPERVRLGLRDPVDQVRAAAVRLVAARSGPDVPEVFAVAVERHWPLSQQAALEVLPDLVQRAGIGDDAARRLLSGVGHMDSQPVSAEHEGLSALARAIGQDRLAGWLDAGERIGVGAARLLLEDGSEAALSALAHRSAGGDPELRHLIEQAAERLRPAEPEHVQEQVDATEHVEEPRPEGEAPTVEVEDEMVAGLARALQDPDEGVRERARDALASLHADQVAGWVGVSLSSEADDRAAMGADVAGAARLSDLVPRIIERALSMSPDERAPFVRALSTLGVSGEAVPGLVGQAQPEQRPDVVRFLWQVAGRAMVEHAISLLEDSSAQVRLAALDVIGGSGDPRAVDVARSVLERDSSPVVRATAIQVIGRAGLEQREATLQKALSDPDPDVRATAVELLVTGMGGRAAHVVLRALSDGDERVWRAAVRSLADVPDHERGVVWAAIVQCPPDRREELLSALEQAIPERAGSLALEHLMSPDPHERTLAVMVAGRSATPEAVRGLGSALQDPAAPVRRAAATALAALRRPSAIPALTGSLYDPDVEVRVEAVRGLSEIDDDDVLDSLISALKDPEVRVRDVAGQALVRWRSAAVAKRLAMALGDPSLRRSAGEVLAQMGTAAVDPLVDLLSERGAEVGPIVGQLLRDLVGPDLFLERLSSMDPDERRHAAEALGAMGGEAGLDGLARALSDPVEGIRIRAVTLMGESRDPRAFEAVKRTFLGDPVQEVVAAAEEALQKLQPGVQPGPH